MTKQGWIALHREIQEHWMWKDKPFSKGQAWIDLLMLANHSDNKFLLGNELVEVKTGSFITSELKLMERWGWGNTKVRSFLNLLETDGMIKKFSDKKKSVITIVNYSVYQGSQSTSKVQTKHKQSTNKVQAKTNNNENNENNENNDNKLSYCDVPELNAALVSFVEYRKKIKKPMTEHAVKLMIGKLNKMTSSIEEQIEIINQSIVNGWQGLFPLKQDNPQPKAQKPSNSSKSEYNDFMAQLAAMRE